TRDRHRAEDVLQNTFLTAIEKAHLYDPHRPLLPWLLAILANDARMQHRRERRIPPATPRARAGGDVADAAASRELAEVCDRAVEALAEPYRHVLLLHLRHGLSGAEIAASLDRPESTVRNQIARGLDLLRRKLPASVAGALAFGTANATGLAAVRAAVLAKAPAAGPAAVATGIAWFGVLLMSKNVVVVLVLLPLLAGGAWYSGAFAGGPPVLAPADAPPATTASVAPAADATAAHEDTLRREPARTDAARPTVGSVHATVVSRDPETPVPDLAYTVLTKGGTRRIVAEGRTSADGTATVEALVPGDYEFCLDASGDSEPFAIEAGAVQQVRCALQPGVRVAGTVVDPDGRPVGDAEVRGDAQWGSVLLARTAADGTFGAAAVRGGSRIWAVGAGRQPCRRHDVGYRDTEQVRLVLGGPGTRLFVRVLDEQDRPAAHARVFVGLDTEVGSSFLQLERHDGRADGNGEFAAQWLKPGHVLVAALPNDGDLERTSLQRLVVEDGVPASVVLHLGDGAIVAGRICNERGEPLAGASVWQSYTDSGMDPIGWRSIETGNDGRFELRGLPPGQHWLSASRGGMRIDERIELAARQHLAWDPVLAEGAPIVLRVSGPDDEPLAHLRVHVLSADRNMKLQGFTDDHGRCRFEHLPPVEQTFQVLAADLAVVLVERTVLPGPDEVTVRVDTARVPSSRLTGRIVDGRGKPVADCQVTLHANSMFVQPQRVDREGRFTTDLLPPGAYGVTARAPAAGLGNAFASAQLGSNEQHDLGDLVLPATASLAIRLRRRDGGAVAGAVLRLGHPRDMTPGTDDLAPDEVDGVHRRSGLDPGSYVLRLFGPDCAPQNVPITLAAGERRELDLTAERAVPICVEIRLRREPPNDALADGVLSVTNAAGERVVFHRLWGYFDDPVQHVVRVHLGLAPGSYRVHAEDLGKAQQDLQIEVRETPPASPYSIDLR
ncbi:MAG TPA: sigma-70 family RNA polymerase sigma factor, partial [Planctomycetota bacterium]|nr:sigma-70 family RNA polymerase sigma factor [Planctomycetota bacterium]